MTLQDATILGGANDWGGYGTLTCTATVAGQLVWDITNEPQDCNAAFLF